MIENSVVPKTNTITTITMTVTTTATPPNAEGTRPSWRSCRANAVAAGRSSGSVSGRGSNEADAAGR